MTTRRSRRLAPALLALTMGLAACSGSVDNDAGPDTTDLDSDQIVLTAALETFDSCDALLDRIKDEALERVGPYGFDQGGPIWLGGIDGEETTEDMAGGRVAADESGAAPAMADSAGMGGDAKPADPQFSGTNNQEDQVDEADLVKTDGERLVVASGNRLEIIDVTGETPSLVDTVQLPDEAYGDQLFLAGDQALLMTSGWTEQPFVGRAWDEEAGVSFPGAPTARLLSIDLEAGEITRSIEFEGSYLSAREVDGSVRVVVSATTDRFAFVYPSNEGAEDAAEAANRALIEESAIEQWLPTYRITEGDDVVTEGRMAECDKVHLPSEFAGFGALVIVTADAENGFELNDSTAVFTDAQTVYASTDRVAVATSRWPTWGPDGEVLDDDDYTTAIHTFDITDPTTASYVASGSVRGHLLNQYSLSEHDGYLRVATTDGSPWGSSGTSESFVTVLAEESGALTEVGQVGGLGKGEQIQAVRFLGDLGYVVTFRQIDPLYVVDLSDPASPTVEGELKIPGFSSYLHPVADGHLLGVGTDGDEEGNTFGTAISLFDVTDRSNPTLVTKLNVDDAADRPAGSSSTEISWDAKAFTWWDEVAIVPVSWWDYSDQGEESGSEAVLIQVDAATGELTELGRVSPPATRECEGGIIEPIPEPRQDTPTETIIPPESTESESTDAEASFADPDESPASAGEVIPAEPDPGIVDDRYCFAWTPSIRRTVVIGDNLYSVTEAGVQVNQFDDLDEVTWISFSD
jgi:hypothetical protein